MNSLKTFGKYLLKIFLYFILFCLLLTTLYYFDVINGTVCSYLRLIVLLLLIYFQSGSLSRKMDHKNFINGLLVGVSVIAIFLILSLVFRVTPNFRSLIYYLLILGISILGGARKKKSSSKKKYI